MTGSLTNEEVLTELCVDRCDLFISLSARDENNIMGALLAKKLGARRVIALTDSDTFSALMPRNADRRHRLVHPGDHRRIAAPRASR